VAVSISPQPLNVQFPILPSPFSVSVPVLVNVVLLIVGSKIFIVPDAKVQLVRVVPPVVSDKLFVPVKSQSAYVAAGVDMEVQLLNVALLAVVPEPSDVMDELIVQSSMSNFDPVLALVVNDVYV
tara:strand:- start:1525 stop:1899 length:375 start_codon:yes stop_codon:yes gene_type:complete